MIIKNLNRITIESQKIGLAIVFYSGQSTDISQLHSLMLLITIKITNILSYRFLDFQFSFAATYVVLTLIRQVAKTVNFVGYIFSMNILLIHHI